MEHATSAWPTVEQHRAPRACIQSRMDRSEEVVESQTPVRQPGEVAERLANLDTVIVDAVPGPDEDDRREDVQGDQATETGEDGGGHEP